MKFINRAFERFVEAREAQAEAYVNDYITDRGIDKMVDLTFDPRG